MWITSGTGSARGGGDFGDFEKVNLLSWLLPRKKTVGFRLLAEARPVAPVAGATRAGGVRRWKSQNRKNVYLSPYAEEPLNSKAIKSFVPELRSRKCFSCFEIPIVYVYIYIYIWTLYVHFAYPYLAMVNYEELLFFKLIFFHLVLIWRHLRR